jgi:hypothetical protein
MKKNYLALAAITALVFSGCSKENSGNNDGSLKITAQIETNTDGTGTKSEVSSFSSSVIGVFVDDANGAYSPSYNSTATVSSGTNSVTPTPSVYINADATVYAYYPATASEIENPASTSTKSITVASTDDFAATSQTDYMWATQASVNKSNRTAALTFNHALAKIIFSIKLGDTYAGTGSLTDIKLTAANSSYEFKAGTGTMAISDGAIAGLSDQATLEYSGTLALSTTASTTTALVAPATLAENTSASSEITLDLTIDGNVYTATLPVSSVAAWAAATSYTYNVTVNSGELTIGTVSIAGWTAGTSTDVTVS